MRSILPVIFKSCHSPWNLVSKPKTSESAGKNSGFWIAFFRVLMCSIRRLGQAGNEGNFNFFSACINH